MSGEALYERYKDALRRGHVASLRGRLEEALAAYAEAASIAPERSTPHTSAGTALSCAASGQPTPSATTTLPSGSPLATMPRCSVGRRPSPPSIDGPRPPTPSTRWRSRVRSRASSPTRSTPPAAAWSWRRAETAAGTLERLIKRLRATEPGEPGRVALERALLVLEGQAVSPGTAMAARVPDGRAPADRRGGGRRRSPSR